MNRVLTSEDNNYDGNQLIKHPIPKHPTNRNTHYKVSGGPIIVTLHSNKLFSSTKPAENPSTGFLQRSASKKQRSWLKNLSFTKSQNSLHIKIK